MDSDRVVVAFAGLNALGMLSGLIAIWLGSIPYSAKLAMSALTLSCAIIWVTIGYYTMTKEP